MASSPPPIGLSLDLELDSPMTRLWTSPKGGLNYKLQRACLWSVLYVCPGLACLCLCVCVSSESRRLLTAWLEINSRGNRARGTPTRATLHEFLINVRSPRSPLNEQAPVARLNYINGCSDTLPRAERKWAWGSMFMSSLPSTAMLLIDDLSDFSAFCFPSGGPWCEVQS